jgi:hypothetical protein
VPVLIDALRAAVAQVVERSPEKAGVGGSTPSRGTIKSTTYKSSETKTCSKLFQNSNRGPSQVCLNNISVGAVALEFASFLKTKFAQNVELRRGDEISADDYRTALFDTELTEAVRCKLNEDLTGDKTTQRLRGLLREIIDSKFE